MIRYLSAPLTIVNSGALRHEVSVPLCNVLMRTVEEVRRLRLAILVAELGSYAALNDKLALNRRDSTLSQVANQSVNKRNGVRKTMGSTMARDLERACNKEPGWMDTDPDLWPFEGIDHAAVRALDQRNLDRLAGALVSTAIQFGLDIQKRRAA